MRRLARIVAAFAFVGAATAGCRRQPEEPLKLHLELATTRIKYGEDPWYRYSVTNVGHKPIRLDTFLCWQSQYGRFVEDQRGWHSILVGDADGKWLVTPDRRHPHFWTNACGGATGCPCKTLPMMGSGHVVRYGPEQPLPGGSTFYATPSIVDFEGNERAKLTRSMVDVPPVWDISPPRNLKPRYPGFRAYDDATSLMPGRYRMKILYRPFGSAGTYDEVKKRLESEGLTLSQVGWPEETRVFEYSTDWVYFEVEAPAAHARAFDGKTFRAGSDKESDRHPSKDVPTEGRSRARRIEGSPRVDLTATGRS